ncbi:MAG: DegV family protein, partial [Halanaerobiales bacterium]
MGIKFIIDSAADLPAEVVEDYNIDVFPLYVSHKEQYFKDREEIKPKTLYDGMREGKVYKTSQVTVNDFAGKFRQYAEADKTVIYFAFSSELSGTMQSAVLAKNQVLKDYPDFDLTIIDTRSASLGIGLALYLTLQAVEEGDSKGEVIEKARYFTGHIHHIFTVDDLEYLVRGGRLGKVAGFVGTIMNIKPILAIEDG